MADRIRSIKPDVRKDEVAVARSDTAWRVWVSSWTFADDTGRFRASAKYIATEVWMDSSDDKLELAEAALEELAATGLIRLYVANGQRYGEVKQRGWKKHQRIDRPGDPKVPVPNDSDYLPAPRESSRILAPRVRARDWDQGDGMGDGVGKEIDPASAGSEPPGSAPPRDNAPGLLPLGPTEDPRQAKPAAPRTAPPAEPEPTDPDRRPSSRAALVGEIFEVYLEGWRRVVHGTRAPVLDDKRKRLIAARLKDFSPDELKAAARGVWKSQWHIENGHTGADLVFRSSGTVERFRDADTKPRVGPASPRTAQRSRLQPSAAPGAANWEPQRGDEWLDDMLPEPGNE